MQFLRRDHAGNDVDLVADVKTDAGLAQIVVRRRSWRQRVDLDHQISCYRDPPGILLSHIKRTTSLEVTISRMSLHSFFSW